MKEKINPDDHIGLIHMVARKWIPPAPGVFPLEDRLSVGYIGLLKAIENYDPSKGVKFSTYAHRVIQTHLLTHQRRHEHRGFEMPHNPVQDAPKVSSISKTNGGSYSSGFEKAIENKEYIDNILSRCTSEEKFVLRNIFAGRKNADIGKDMGCGKANVSRIYRIIIKRERKLYEERNNCS